ncbi:MAG: HlyD family secretion protein [Marinifilaceae bacterium]|jgi:multidrug resistance efflux pump|nr:HlyD family secretion protein [Marinifilaceae bacterium]
MAKKKIVNNSSEVQEVMGQVPSWTLRYGILIIFIILMVLAILSYFYKSPEVKKIVVRISSTSPSVSVNSKIGGKIDTVFVNNGLSVGKKDMVLAFSNSANINSVLNLLDRIKLLEYKEYSIDLISRICDSEITDLGELQLPYSILVKALEDYKVFMESTYYTSKKKLLRNKILVKDNLLKSYKTQLIYQNENYQILKKSFRNDSILYCKGVVSRKEFENYKTSFLNSSLENIRFKDNIKQLNLDLLSLKESLVETNKENINKRNLLLSDIRNRLIELKTKLDIWKSHYILSSPIKGNLHYSTKVCKNMVFEKDIYLFTIVPEVARNPVALGYLSKEMMGNVKLGQSVNIRLYNYPSKDYGYIKGKISLISRIPVLKDNYLITISFPNGLITDSRKEIDYIEDLSGEGEIILEDESLLHKILYSFVK